MRRASLVAVESVVLPTARPDLFGQGLTRYAKGVLLFGPPGKLERRCVREGACESYFQIAI